MDTFDNKIIKRAKLFALKFSWQLPYVSWKTLINQTLKGDLKLNTLIKKIDHDSQYGLSLYRVPGYQQPLWCPDAEPKLLDIDADLTFCDYYHGLRIAGLINKNDVVLDCGGFIGLFTLWALKKKASKIIVFEPLEKNYECINRNLRHSIDTGKVVLIKAGVWSSKGGMEFFEDDAGCGSTFLKDSIDPTVKKDVGDKKWIQKVHNKIDVVTIDEVVKELNLPTVDFIKMDIEGAEPEALLGSKATLLGFIPNLAICTYHQVNHREMIYSSVKEINPMYGKCTVKQGSLISCWKKKRP